MIREVFKHIDLQTKEESALDLSLDLDLTAMRNVLVLNNTGTRLSTLN